MKYLSEEIKGIVDRGLWSPCVPCSSYRLRLSLAVDKHAIVDSSESIVAGSSASFRHSCCNWCCSYVQIVALLDVIIPDTLLYVPLLRRFVQYCCGTMWPKSRQWGRCSMLLHCNCGSLCRCMFFVLLWTTWKQSWTVWSSAGNNHFDYEVWPET